MTPMLGCPMNHNAQRGHLISYAMLSMSKPLFSGTLYANDLNIHVTVYCLRLNQKTNNYTHVRGA